MRWMWVDRFTMFVSGQRCQGVKCVALDEEVVDEYLPGYPVLPCSLMIEGLAQCGGLLVAESFDFDKRVVLAKVNKAEFHAPARPGDRLTYDVQLETIQGDGAVVQGTVRCDETLVAQVELMFAFLEGERFGQQMLFGPRDLRLMLQLMQLYEVAVDAEGNPRPVSRNLFEPSELTA